MRTTLVFYPNEGKKNTKTNKIPIYLRVVHNQRKAEGRLNVELTESELIKWNAFNMRLDDRHSSVNNILNSISSSFENFKILNATKLFQHNAAMVRDFLIGNKKETGCSILEYAINYYYKTIVDNTKLAAGTKRNYLKALKHFQNFTTITKATNKPLEEIDVKFATSFLDYLLNDNATLKRKGMTEVSACGLIKKMRTIYERAFKEELIRRNPFKEIKVRNRSPFRQKMNISEVAKWYNCDLKSFPTQDIYRDIYFFSFLTGLAYSDMASLSYSNLLPIGSNEILLKKARRKTNEIVEVVLVSYAIDIIEKYRNHPDKKEANLVFPTRSLNSANIYNRILADRMGITTKITTHIARHTFRQLLPEAGIQDNMVIKRMMGQSPNGDIDAIYYQVTESALIQAKKKFQFYLDKHLKHLNRTPKLI